eukprot:Selendium_serpulae@DN5612_c0_g1_i2.p1
MSDSYHVRRKLPEEVGSGYGMGCIGGFMWHFVSGIHHAPRGESMASGIYRARMRAPISGNTFAVWVLCFSLSERAIQKARGKEGQANAIGAGFTTGCILGLRGGWRVAMKQGVTGGTLLAIIEGLSLVWNRSMANKQTPRLQFQQSQKMEADKMANQPQQSSSNSMQMTA